ncbi:MAG: glycosyltransferase family 4 protein [Nanoarchaeota archaeon]
MKILMLGFEFPPFFAGGVGIACYEISKSLAKRNDVEIEYIMPYGPDEKQIHHNFKILSANSKKLKNLTVTPVPTMIAAYDSEESYMKRFLKFLSSKNLFSNTDNIKKIYGENLIEEIYMYAQRVAALCKDKDFDVIHAHDWTTIPAALLLKELTGKPVILHVHITELDKTGGQGGHHKVFEIEKEGFNKADILIAVSNFTKNRLVYNYGVDPNKIRIIHNGGISDLSKNLNPEERLKKEDKIVLYAGRVTLQKGVEYFVRAAKKVLEVMPETKFLIAGGGDKLPEMIELVAELGIGKNVLFTGGAYTREEAKYYFSIADIFVMPSVSEPFGIVPLEAVANGTPTIISKQSGISEVLAHTFKVDFWDTEEMAHKICSLLTYPALHSHMRESAFNEFHKFSWDKPANEFVKLYHEIAQK